MAVVIPCRNEAATIEALLDAIERQHHLPDEVLLVDDQSIDETVAIARAWSLRCPRIRFFVVPGPGRGPAAAMNAGISRCESDIVVRLDGHCRPHPQYIAHAVETLLSREAGIVGGVWEIRPGASTAVGRAIAAVVAHPIGSGGATYRNARHSGVHEVDTVPFGCFRRSLWQQLGGYDEALASNEDYDFNFRIRMAGEKVLLNSEIRSIYWSRPTLATLGRQYFRYGFWKIQMLSKSPRAFRVRQLPPALIVPWLVISGALAALSWHPLALLLAAFYPAAVSIASLRIAGREPRLVLPILGAIVVQHVSWSAGFWQGLIRVVQLRM